MNEKTRGEQDIEMTARLYDCRSAARGILGDKFVSTLQPWRESLARVVKATGRSVLSVTIEMGKGLSPDDGIGLMLLFAAAVEEIESGAGVGRCLARLPARKT